MPTYDYECLECKHRFEVFHSIKDNPIVKCGKCGGKVKKLIGSGAGIIFKGSGFYVTDYKNGKSCASKSESKVESPVAGSCQGCCGNNSCGVKTD